LFDAEAVWGTCELESNGVPVLAPLIPKTVIQASAVNVPDSVAFMVAEKVDVVVAYHSVRYVLYEG
jgi:hypothetical protein